MKKSKQKSKKVSKNEFRGAKQQPKQRKRKGFQMVVQQVECADNCNSDTLKESQATETSCDDLDNLSKLISPGNSVSGNLLRESKVPSTPSVLQQGSPEEEHFMASPVEVKPNVRSYLLDEFGEDQKSPEGIELARFQQHQMQSQILN